MRTIIFSLVVIVLSAASLPLQAQISTLNPIKNPSLSELRENFVKPHRDYSTGPLWTWNDLLTEEQVRSTLRDFAGQNVKQVWVHPRPGLMTPYLSDDWFRLWKASLDEAEKLDMNLWIYDENSYPSGFAGGFVPEALPDSRGMGLIFSEVEQLDSIDQIDAKILYIFEPTGQSYKNVTATARRDGKLPPLPSGQRYLVGRVEYVSASGWFGGWWYADILKKGVTEKFIEITHEAYKKHLGGHFGKRIPGIFTDEPHPSGGRPPLGGESVLTWNEEIPELFEKKFGYSLIDNMASLHKPVGDWRKVRHNYQALILELFVDRWAKPNFEWCEANNLQWTGHYWEHGWPDTSHGPDNMAMYIWHQRPGIDMLLNMYDDNSANAQFGNVRAVKELASIVNQMGHSRTLSENYGAGGWDMRFEDFKRLGDWSYVLGVNTNNEHLSYVTLRGARKRDHPPSFSYHAPWFEGYHVLADYFTRLSYMLSQGRQINHIVVLEPTTTAWMYQNDPKLGEIGQNFTDFVNALEHAQVEYDLASEDTIARLGKVDGKTFSIHLGKYDLVILPPNTENLNLRTAELLEQYVSGGGRLLYAEFPTRLDGVELNADETALLRSLANLPNVEKVSQAQAVAIAKKRTAETGLSIDVPEGTRSVFHHRRILQDCEILFICNVDLNRSVGIQTDFGRQKQFFVFNLNSGKIGDIETFPGEFRLSTKDLKFNLPPSGSVLLVLSDKTTPPAAGKATSICLTPLPGSEMSVKRLEPNVLTLDFVDVKIGDEERKDQYAWRANRWIFEKHQVEVMAPGGPIFANPWDNSVQFRDELITKTFPENSGFEATYRFVIEESGDTVPGSLAIVIERPDLYEIFCNSEPVAVQPDAWWLDKSFGKIDLSKTAKVGENTVKIVAKPMTVWHELEPAYLLGDFSLRSADKGFVVGPATQSPTLLPWSEQGMPFYAGKVEYSRSFNVDTIEGKFAVKLPDSPNGWYGATARILVNGNDAGFVVSAPWTVDVTKFVKPGRNDISVQVYGTPKNLLGPHHFTRLRGIAGPGHFQHGPDRQPAGNAYDVIGYGMFEAFELIHVVELIHAVGVTSPQKRTFFALCMDTHDEKQRSVEEQNKMLAELGFDGVAHLWLDKLEERVTTARNSKLHVSQVYFSVDLSQNPPFDPKLREALPHLKGEKTQLALLIYGGRPSDESLDDKAVGIIQEIVDIAEPNGVKVVLYPHVDAWNETVADCVRIAKRFPDKKVGAMFNLCHWAAVDKSENLKKTLEDALPYLACITINGTDTPEEIQSRPGRAGWLQPLDTGSFDQKKLQSLLDEIGYFGPVGLQCYGITGDARIHLERSMKKWRDMQ